MMKTLLTVLFSVMVQCTYSSNLMIEERAQGHCADLSHNEMDYECLIHMWDFYHIGNAGWEKCETFLSSFSTAKYPASSKCLVYRSKCADMNNDKPCCKSIHCHLWLIGAAPTS
ncbi:hypothetical protein ACHWQZ_G000233 [Mnemiopsis leidyi]